MTRPAAVLAGGLVLLAAGVLATLARSDDRLAGANNVPRQQFVALVPAKATLCQRDEFVPAGTGALRLLIGTYYRPGGSVRLSIRSRAGGVTRGGLAPGWEQGDVRIPVEEVRRDVRAASVCLTNGGDSRIAIAGSPGPRESAARVSGKRARGRVHVHYLHPRRESWLQAAPRVARRFAVGKPGFMGSWTFTVALLLSLAALAGGTALALRGLRP